MARTSSPSFDEHERPTAKRGRPDEVDMANAANRTQKIDKREVLAALEGVGPQSTSSGTRRAPSADEIAQFAADRAAAKQASEPAARQSIEPAPVARPRFAASPTVLAIAVVLSLLVGFVAGRLL